MIAAEEGIPVTTIRDNVQRLVERGLVERVPNPRDRRSYLLVRTPDGATALDVGGAVLAGIYGALEAKLPRPADEYDRLLVELRDAIAAVATERRGAREVDTAPSAG